MAGVKGFEPSIFAVTGQRPLLTGPHTHIIICHTNMKKTWLLAAKFATYQHIKVAGVDITIDDSDFEESVREYIGTFSVDQEELDSWTKQSLKIFNENAQKAVESIKKAISDVSWNGSKIVLRPSKYYDSIMGEYLPITLTEEEPWIEAGTFWYVIVDTDIKRMSPGFTYIMQGDEAVLGDVLDAGDAEFFTNSLVEADYFGLVNGLRRLGKEPEEERIVTLFTARPRQERELYKGKREIPNNIWLTKIKSEADGIASDLADYIEDPETGEMSQEIRDVYTIKINSKYLMPTDHPNHFQAYNPGSSTVPIEYIYLW